MGDRVATEAARAFVTAQGYLVTLIAQGSHQFLSVPMADSSALAPTMEAAPMVSKIASLGREQIIQQWLCESRILRHFEDCLNASFCESTSIRWQFVTFAKRASSFELGS